MKDKGQGKWNMDALKHFHAMDAIRLNTIINKPHIRASATSSFILNPYILLT
jgi:hypothetical protein